MANPRKPESKESFSLPGGQPAPAHAGSVAIPRLWFLAGLGVLIAPWIVVGVLYFRPSPPAEVDVPTQAAIGESRKAKPGPWGHLTITPIVVSPPLEFVAADWGRPEGPYRWYFPGTSPELLRAFLSSSGLTPDQVARLESTVERDPRIAGLTLKPDLEVLRSLSPEVRARLYLELAKSSLNGDQANSFRFFGTSSTAWLGGSLIGRPPG
jgi:hypothetical protein